MNPADGAICSATAMGGNLTYLDGELVQGATPVESGAMIEVGETTLRFQAFCTEEFDWPDLDD